VSQNSRPDSLVLRAQVEGLLQGAPVAPSATDVLVANLTDTVLLGCVGAGVDALDATEVTLVSVLLDMSGSMSSHQRGVREAWDLMLESLRGAKAATSILVSAWTFADVPDVLSGYRPASDHAPLGASYSPGGCTALHDALLGAMTGLVSYGQALAESGVPSKRVLFVLTDGADNASRVSAADVKRVASALQKDEAYTLAFAGFGSNDLVVVADSLGFKQVITTGASASDLRRVFRQVSQSVIRVSQSAAGAAGGFF